MLCEAFLTAENNFSNNIYKEENAISYLVCHMEKYHKTDIAPIEKENERDENYEAKNPQIDSERTSNNYHLVRRDDSYTAYINNRLAEEGIKPRKDAVLMCSFVITSDGDYFKKLSFEKENQFFADATVYFARRYGRENIISAVVHKDETTPHLHLNLIPISNGRLCAKDLFCQQSLRELQSDFYEKVGKKYGLERGKENSHSKHLSTAEFKAKTIVERAENKAERIEEQCSLLETKRDELKAELDADTDYKKALEQAKNGEIARSKKGLRNQVVALTAENARLESELKTSYADREGLYKLVQELSPYKTGYRCAKEAITMFRASEPEAFVRMFFRAPSVFELFIPTSQPPAFVRPGRLIEIQEEIEREKKIEALKAKTSSNSEKFSKAD